MKNINFDQVFKIAVLVLLIAILYNLNASSKKEKDFASTDIGRYQGIKFTEYNPSTKMNQDYICIYDSKTGKRKYD